MRRLLIAATALIAAPVLWASAAHATPTIEWSTSGTSGSFTTLSTVAGSGNSQIYTGGTLNGLSVGVTSVSSNSPGTPGLAEVLSANLSITNSGSTSETLYLSFGDTGFTAPGAPPTLAVDSHIGGTVPVAKNGDAVEFTSFVDPNNVQNSITGAGIFGTGTGIPVLPAVNNGSFSNDQNLFITSLGTPYSMTELLEVTIAAGSQINFSASTTLTPVPEPASLALLGSGLLGFAMIRRRRNRQS